MCFAERDPLHGELCAVVKKGHKVAGKSIASSAGRGAYDLFHRDIHQTNVYFCSSQIVIEHIV